MAADHRAAERDALFLSLQTELRRLAGRVMAGERRDHTLGPTALLNEAWIRVARSAAPGETIDRGKLVAMAGRAMGEVLVDHARRRRAEKRGGGRRRVPLDDVMDQFAEAGLDVAEVHEALNELARTKERQAAVITLRFFGGFSVREVADQLGVSIGTVEADYRLARAWLYRRLGGAPG